MLIGIQNLTFLPCNLKSIVLLRIDCVCFCSSYILIIQPDIPHMLRIKKGMKKWPGWHDKCRANKPTVRISAITANWLYSTTTLRFQLPLSDSCRLIFLPRSMFGYRPADRTTNIDVRLQTSRPNNERRCNNFSSRWQTSSRTDHWATAYLVWLTKIARAQLLLGWLIVSTAVENLRVGAVHFGKY